MGGIKLGHGFGRQERGRDGIPNRVHIRNHACYAVQLFQFLIHGNFLFHVSLGNHEYDRIGGAKHAVDRFHIASHLCGPGAVYLTSSVEESILLLAQERNRENQSHQDKHGNPQLHDQSGKFIKRRDKAAMLCFIYQAVCRNSQGRQETKHAHKAEYNSL